MSNDPYRLPTDVIPSHYRLHLAPDLNSGTFSGQVTINADVVVVTKSIVCNSDGLNLSKVTVDGKPCAWDLDPELERLSITGDSPFAVGPVEIHIEFDGRFNDKLVGFYLSTFSDADGTDHSLATTQFEATHARKAFPCWDEPSAKATYVISLLVPAGMDAISNAAAAKRTDHGSDGEQIIEFAPTMKMSTYLVAFVVGPIEFSRTVDVDGTPVRIVHVPGKGHLTDFALDCAAFALRYFADYFGTPYPGDKCDLVAIPDFAFGAMENLGCITFREVLLLVDPNAATQPELQRTADVINHELAHMWFGDLVTMLWWNGLWLNEAFATFMEMRCTDAYRPEWQRWVDFGLSRTAAFDTDALASTRPIEFKVTSPEEAEGMFDILTYEKGAAVVRMLEQYLGEDQFRAGIRRYIADNAYGNAETTDLWDAIEKESQKPVRAIMDTWIFQGGFPLVSVKISPDGRTASLHQSRFSYAGGDPAPDTSWQVPVMARQQVRGAPEPEGEQVALLLEGTEPLEVPIGDSTLVVINAEGAGFCRVEYPPSHLDALAGAAIGLGPVERYALIDDAWASVLADRTSTPAFLNLLEAMSGETDRSVWQRIIAGFTSLDHLLGGDGREALAEIARDVFSPALTALGLAPDPHDDDRTKQLRGDLIAAMGILANDLEVQTECQRTVSVGRRNPELVDPALMAAAVSVTASIGDGADFADFVSQWHNAQTPQEEMRYLYALAGFPEPEQAAQLRQMVLDGDVRAQNAAILLARAIQNRENGRDCWQFVVENWGFLNDFLPSSSIPRMVAAVTSLDHPADAKAVGAFFATHPLPQAEQTLAQILERQRVRVALREREAERLNLALIR